jgi:catechol 2,3-dioxygenase-like lactoylglutathione lyase family enzyme
MTRRDFVHGLAAFALFQRAARAQPPDRPVIRPKTLNHVAFFASDVRRTAAWYQELFGFAVQFRTDGSEPVAVLRIGSGPEFIALYPANGAKPGFKHMGFGVENFDRATVERALAAHNVKGDWRTRKAAEGDVEELVLRDPDNLMIQVQDVRYSGGGGRRGDVWGPGWTSAPQSARARIAVRAVNHVTFGSASKESAEKFYRDLFGLPVLSWDYRPSDPSRILGISVDAPRQFIAPGQGRTIGVSHYCFGVDGFDRERIAKTLSDHGIAVPPTGTPRPGCCGSAVTYNPAETVYGRDPDGFSVQFTDSNFCAGIGPLGTMCIV